MVPVDVGVQGSREALGVATEEGIWSSQHPRRGEHVCKHRTLGVRLRLWGPARNLA